MITSFQQDNGVLALITLLFDIDGTLLRAGGAGMNAVHKALEVMFGPVEFPDISVHGRTDHGIMSDVFQFVSRDYQEHRKAFDDLYWQLLPAELDSAGGSLLPGVLPLLERLATDPDIALGILTGNSKSAAKSKLVHFGVDHFFTFGGYGDHHSDRNDVAASAVANAQMAIGDRFRGEHVWVIGDTVNDIRCARSVSAKVLVVETGGGTPAELANAEPDVQLTDLNDGNEFISKVKNFR